MEPRTKNAVAPFAATQLFASAKGMPKESMRFYQKVKRIPDLRAAIIQLRGSIILPQHCAKKQLLFLLEDVKKDGEMFVFSPSSS